MRDRPPAVNTRRAAIAFGVCISVVLVLTLMPVHIPNHFPLEDKLHHILAFMALAVLARAAWQPRWWLLIPALTALGGAIEIAQIYIPNRSCELGDLIGDAMGAMLGWVLYPLLLRVYCRFLARRKT